MRRDRVRAAMGWSTTSCTLGDGEGRIDWCPPLEAVGAVEAASVVQLSDAGVRRVRLPVDLADRLHRCGPVANAVW